MRFIASFFWIKLPTKLESSAGFSSYLFSENTVPLLASGVSVIVGIVFWFRAVAINYALYKSSLNFRAFFVVVDEKLLGGCYSINLVSSKCSIESILKFRYQNVTFYNTL